MIDVARQFAPYFAVMLMLLVASAFFSCSEAALFSLRNDDRRLLAKGNRRQRAAVELLRHPDRLLSAILFWNLIVNLVFFALSSIIGIALQNDGRSREAATIALASLLIVILFGEMAPKTFGVQQPRLLASLVSLPLSGAVKALDPIMPLFSATNRLLERIFFPKFQREHYLEVADLERAIELSTDDAQLAAREQQVLQNIVSLSELTASELMRPRTQYRSFRPPVHLDDLERSLPPGGFLLLSEEDSDEVVAAIDFGRLAAAPRRHLEKFAQPLIYVPWCATVAMVFDDLQQQDRELAAVVNEYGETIGIVTIEDMLETIFDEASSRSARFMALSSIVPAGEGRWLVTGMTNLSRLSRHFNVDLAECQSVTVGGILQECLQRLPEAGDEVPWSGFNFRVLAVDERRRLEVELTLLPTGGPLP